MLHKLDFNRRAPWVERMDEPCTRDQMRACLREIARVNGWMLAYRPTLDWLNSLRLERLEEPVRILDAGCGYGDALRRIEKWACARGIRVELTGLDLHPDAASIAREAGGNDSGIEWITADVLSYVPARPSHIVVSSQFAHHLLDDEVVRFVRWMETHATLAWFINDLSRAPVPYHMFRWFARIARLHPFVQYDGPVSVARAFQAHDWQRLCAAAGLADHQYRITAWKPARLCVSRSKPQ
jgi:SAM-dependent methyltransferase